MNFMEKEHSYKKFDKDLKAGKIKNVLLLYGKEQYLVKWSVDGILKKYVSDECRVFDFSEIDPEKASFDDIVQNCETLSMFSEKRIVCMPGFPQDEERLAEYIKKIPDTCILIITAEKADKRKKLYKEIAALGDTYDFEPLDERTLKSFIEKRFTSFGKTVKPHVTGEFIRRSGYFLKETEYTLFNIENEIKKIAAHCDGDEIGLSDVLEVLSADADTFIFSLIEAVGRNEKDEAFKLLHNLISSGTGFVPILSLLASQFETILDVKEMKEEGKSQGQMHSMLGIHEYRIKKAAAFSSSFSTAQLKNILKKIYQADKDIKTGMMEPVLSLEVMISEI